MSRKTIFAFLGCMSAILLILAACQPSTTTPTTTPPASPTLAITSPANGASLPAGNITVTTSVTNFNVVDKQSQAAVTGEGHLHFYLDIDAPTTPGVAAAPTSGVWAHVSGTSYTFPDVAPGTHTISAQLVNNDHTPVIPLVIQKITITVTAPPTTTPPVTPAPTLTITSPADGASVSGNITVTAAVTNFNVVDKQGQAAVAGEGHLHFYLDIDAPTTPGVAAAPTSGVWAHVSDTSHTFTDVAPGSHTISAQLVNNDHTPVIPLVIQKITVTVAAPAATTPPTTTTPPPTSSANTTVGLSSSASLGNFLVDGSGMTLYWTTLDTPGQSNVTGATLAEWPVFYTATITVPATLNAADFGTITRGDGSQQTTYKGYPLYYYVLDQKPGDTLGQGVGNVWFVVNPTSSAPVAPTDGVTPY